MKQPTYDMNAVVNSTSPGSVLPDSCNQSHLSLARSTPATMSKQHCRMLQCRMLLRHCCRFWQQCRSNVRLCCPKRQHCRTSFALKFRPFDKVERCFDIVASVDRALHTVFITTRWLYCVECPQCSIQLDALGYLCTSCLLPALDEA